MLGSSITTSSQVFVFRHNSVGWRPNWSKMLQFYVAVSVGVCLCARSFVPCWPVFVYVKNFYCVYTYTHIYLPSKQPYTPSTAQNPIHTNRTLKPEGTTLWQLPATSTFDGVSCTRSSLPYPQLQLVLMRFCAGV